MFTACIIALLQLNLTPISPSEIKIDGFFDDWSDRPVLYATHTISGTLSPNDLSAQVNVAFDPQRLYVGIQVIDDKFQPGGAKTGDRLTLRFHVQGKRHDLHVLLNGLEETPPTLRLGTRPVRRGVKMMGTYRRDGWAVEFSMPLKTIPGLTQGKFGFAAIFSDADADPTTFEAVVSTAALNAAGLPKSANLELGGTGDLLAAFKAEQGSIGQELQRIEGQIIPGGPTETLVITDKHIILVGHGLPDRAGYLYFSHGWRTKAALKSAKLKNLDGRRGLELIVEHSDWAIPDETQVEVVEIYGVHDGYLKRMFAHKLGEYSPQSKARARSEISFLKPRRGQPWHLSVSVAKLTNLNQGNYIQVDPRGQVSFEPLVLPWESKKPVIYQLEKDVWHRR